MDDEIGGNKRRRSRQGHEINREEEEDDRKKTSQRRRTNQVVNETQNDGAQAAEDDLSLSLGLPLYPSGIPPMPMMPSPSQSLHVPPPSYVAHPMTTWPSFDLLTPMTSSPYSMAPYYLPSSSPLSNSLFQTVSIQPPIVPPVNPFPPPVFATPARSGRAITSAADPRQNSNPQCARNQKSKTIPQPYPWATTQRGKIQSLEHLESKQITTITGDVQCKYCEKVYPVSYNLREKFSEVEHVFLTTKMIMRERAPEMWTNPVAARCELCGREKAVKPVIAEKKSKINWLFLLLGQTLGYCTLEQLKNFCKHSKSHRTGAKDRVLYLTYLSLCNMLEPNRELFRYETTTFRR